MTHRLLFKLDDTFDLRSVLTVKSEKLKGYVCVYFCSSYGEVNDVLVSFATPDPLEKKGCVRYKIIPNVSKAAVETFKKASFEKRSESFSLVNWYDPVDHSNQLDPTEPVVIARLRQYSDVCLAKSNGRIPPLEIDTD